MEKTIYYECPCCNHLVFKELHCFEICPICGWEDDNVQFEDPNFSGGANKLSLNDYRINYFHKKGRSNV